MPNSLRSCTCNAMARPDLSPRQMRRGLVLHDQGGNLIVLLKSSSPGIWNYLEESSTNKLRMRGGRLFGTFHRAGPVYWSKFEAPAVDISTAISMNPALTYSLNKVVKSGGAPGAMKSVPPAAPVSHPTPSGTVYKVGTVEELEEILSGKPAANQAAPKTPKKYVARAKTVGNGGTFAPPTINPKHYFYNSERDARYMKDFIALRRAGFVTNLMVVGPSGFGKTDSIVHLAAELSMPLYTMNCQVVTTPERWIGGMQVDPTRGTYFEMSEHLKHVEATEEGYEPGIILYDEVSRLRPDLLNMQFSLWDFQQGLEIPQLGRTVRMHPQNVVIATANMGAAYVGTFGLDRALRERFSSTLERGMPPSDEEVKVLVSAVGIEEDAAKVMVDIANLSRDNWKSGNIDAPISTRTLITWAAYVAGGYEIKDAAEYTVVPQYPEDGGDESERTKVRQMIATKVGS